jgi:hypothetical protein
VPRRVACARPAPGAQNLPSTSRRHGMRGPLKPMSQRSATRCRPASRPAPSTRSSGAPGVDRTQEPTSSATEPTMISGSRTTTGLSLAAAWLTLDRTSRGRDMACPRCQTWSTKRYPRGPTCHPGANRVMLTLSHIGVPSVRLRGGAIAREQMCLAPAMSQTLAWRGDPPGDA